MPVKDMPAEVRRRAKAINFGIIYGISAFGLANQLGIPREEAGAYIKRYFERFPGIRDYMDATKKLVRETGVASRPSSVANAISRASPRPMPSERAFYERAGDQCADSGRRRRHHPPRHGAHGRGARAGGARARKCCCRCMTNWCSRRRRRKPRRRSRVVARVMEQAPLPAVTLSVPLQVDARAAQNWDEAH